MPDIPKRVVVLYDSSYLMGLEDARGSPRFGGFLHAACEPLRRCAVTNVLPEEVEQELGRHLAGSDEQKKRLASFARKRAVELSRDGDPSMPPCERVRMAESVRPAPVKSPLGPDSEIDRLQIAYGIALLQRQSCDAVVLASRDGGIEMDVPLWRKETGLPLYCLSDPRDEAQLCPLRELVGTATPEVEPPAAPGFPPTEPTSVLEGPTAPIRCIEFSPDGGIVAAVSQDGQVRLWRVPNGEPLATLQYPVPIEKLAFSANGGMAAATAADGATWVWRVADSHPVALLQPPTPYKSLFDVRFLGGELVAVQGREPTDATVLNLWRIENGELWDYYSDGGSADKFRSFWFSPDGGVLAAVVNKDQQGFSRQECVLQLRDPRGRQWTAAWEFEYAGFGGHGCVRQAVFSADGHWLAAGHITGSLHLVDLRTHQLRVLDDRRTPPGSLGTGNPAQVTAIAFSPDGQLVASGSSGGAVGVWSVATGAHLDTRLMHSSINRLLFTPDSRLLAAHHGSVSLLSMPDCELVARLPAQLSPPYPMVFSHDGNSLVATDPIIHRAVAELWVGPDWKRAGLLHLTEVGPHALSPDGGLLATGNLYRTREDRTKKPVDYHLRLWRIHP